MQNKVKCPICQQHLRQITNSHLKTHGLTAKQFKEIYPKISLVSNQNKITNKQNASLGVHKSQCNVKAKEKHILAVKLYNTNPNVCSTCSKELDYSKRKNKFCSRSCRQTCLNKNRVHSDNTKQKLSKQAKQNPSGAVLRKRLGLPIRRKKAPTVERVCGSCNQPYLTHPSRNKKYCSKQCYFKCAGGYRPNSTRVQRTKYKDQQMDSGAELVFAKMLDSVNIKWIKNTKQYFTYTRKSGKPGKYFPDFFLLEYDLWVEIKGKKYVRDEDDLRLNSVGNIILIMSHELKHAETVFERILAEGQGFEP